MVYDLSQAEADALMAMEKRRIDEQVWSYPGMGGGLSIPVVSIDGREKFVLDLYRGRVNLAKGVYQNRGRRVVPLLRLCFGGSLHINPDNKPIECPHLHIYREGYGHKWAFPLPEDKFADSDDKQQVFQDFLQFCNIVQPPHIRWGLSA